MPARGILDVPMKKTLALAAAWLPFLVLWLIFGMQMGVTFRQAFPRSLFAIGSAAILGLAVSKLCATMPLQLRPRFYLLHMSTAALYAAVWTGGMVAFEGKAVPRSLLVGWFLEGVWIYAIIAGASYAFQTQRRALQAEKGLAVARLDALRSRLHPHFLFNALHTVGALVRHDPAEAESAVEKLGDMLRYTLRDGDGDVVPFAEEWEFTRRYLEFEQLRYGERLRVNARHRSDGARTAARRRSRCRRSSRTPCITRSTRAPRAAGSRFTRRRSDASLQICVRDDGGNGLPPAQVGHAFRPHALRERLTPSTAHR